MNVNAINPLSLPSLPVSQRKNLPKTGVIYFVLEGQKLLYIGKAKNLRHRWNNHKLLNENLNEAAIAWYELADEYSRRWTERSLIRKYEPPFNITDTPRFYDSVKNNGK